MLSLSHGPIFHPAASSSSQGWPKCQGCVGAGVLPSPASGSLTRSTAELIGLTLAATITLPRSRSLVVPRPNDLKAAAKAASAAPTAKRKRWLRWTDLDNEILQVWPSAVANLILPAIVGSVDLFWIAQSGDPHAIAGVGATNQVYNTIYFLIGFLPHLVTPRIAEEIRKNRPKRAAKWVTEALSFASLMGLLGSFALVFFPHSILKLVADSPQVLSSAVPYCRIRGVSLIATLCGSVSFATFRGLLDFATPLKVGLVTNLLNAALDPLLMNTFGMGVSGVALASTVTEVLNAVVFVALLRRNKLLAAKPTLPAMATLKTFLQNGLAVQVRSVSTNFMFLLAVRRVTIMDPTGVQAAAYQVTQQFWNLAGYVSLGVSNSGAGLIPNKYYDANAGVDEARRLADRLYLWGCCLGVILCFLQLACLPLVGVLAPIKEVQEAAHTPAILAAILQILNGAVFAGEGILVGLKAYGWLAASSGIGCAFMVACLYLFGDKALTGLWLGLYLFNISRLVASVSHRLRFGPLAWRNRRLAHQPSEMAGPGASAAEGTAKE